MDEGLVEYIQKTEIQFAKFEVNLPAKADKTVYGQRIAISIHLKENSSFKVTLISMWGMKTALSISEDASVVFEQKNINEFYLYLWKVNCRTSNEHVIYNICMSILSHALHYFAGKSFI